jgi:hypothetical protein
MFVLAVLNFLVSAGASLVFISTFALFANVRITGILMLVGHRDLLLFVSYMPSCIAWLVSGLSASPPSSQKTIPGRHGVPKAAIASDLGPTSQLSATLAPAP